MPGAEVRYPNEVSPGDFLSAANVKTVRKNVAHRSIQQRPECANVQNAAHRSVQQRECANCAVDSWRECIGCKADIIGWECAENF